MCCYWVLRSIVIRILFYFYLHPFFNKWIQTITSTLDDGRIDSTGGGGGGGGNVRYKLSLIIGGTLSASSLFFTHFRIIS